MARQNYRKNSKKEQKSAKNKKKQQNAGVGI
jgi:hypothetical protein